MSSNHQVHDRYVKISKYLSKYLRYRADRLELEVLLGGWMKVDTLLELSANNGFPISVPDLEQVVATNA
jgi:putative RNA 2'-phosphotransferase